MKVVFINWVDSSNILLNVGISDHDHTKLFPDTKVQSFGCYSLSCSILFHCDAYSTAKQLDIGNGFNNLFYKDDVGVYRKFHITLAVVRL